MDLMHHNFHGAHVVRPRRGLDMPQFLKVGGAHVVIYKRWLHAPTIFKNGSHVPTTVLKVGPHNFTGGSHVVSKSGPPYYFIF